MTARRDKGSGSVDLKRPGVYRLRVYVGKDPLTGKARYASKTVNAKTITEARRQLREFITEQQGQVVGTDATVRTLMAEWVRHLESMNRAARTVTEARLTVDRVILPAIGDVPIRDLTARHIDQMYQAHAHLKPSSRRRYHAVLSAALEQAVTWDWIERNPAKRASIPPHEESVVRLPTRAEVSALIDAMPTEIWKMALRLAVLTGARRGELCGLRWSDIDGEGIHIRRSVYRLKGETHEKRTKGGRERLVALDPAVENIVALWAIECDVRATDAGLGMPDRDSFVLSAWPDCSRPLNPDTLSAHVRRAAVELGMGHVHLHSIRHFAATEMLSAGIDVRQVADTLGHADGGKLALRTYGHPTDDRQRAAAAAMARGLTP